MVPCRPRVELALSYSTPDQSEIGRSMGLGIFTLCGEISTLMTSIRVCSLFVGVFLYMWIDSGPEIRPYSSRITVTLCTVSGQ